MTLQTQLIDAIAQGLEPFAIRGKYRVLNMLTPRTGVVSTTLHGYRVTLDLADWIQRHMFLRTHYGKETKIVRAHLKPGDCFVDVGANVGAYSLLAAAVVGAAGRVLAFEPNAEVRAKLERTVAQNAIAQIEIFACALAEREYHADLFAAPADHANRTATLVDVGLKPAASVTCRRLADVIQERRVDMIHYLKIDADGFESKILAGADELLCARRIRFLQVEFSDYWLTVQGQSCQQLHDTVCGYGFEDIQGRPALGKNETVDRFFRLVD